MQFALSRLPALRRATVAAVQRRTYVTGTIVTKNEPVDDAGRPDVPLYFVDDAAHPVSPWHDIPVRQGFGLTGLLATPTPSGGDASAARPSPLSSIALRRAAASVGIDAAAPTVSVAAEPDEAVFNFVCEIPRGSRAKMEISTTRAFNPIQFDRNRDGSPRMYALDSLVNYGALPQTYEDPDHTDEWTGLQGDGDPIDVCEIGTLSRASTGSLYQVRILGALGLIDGGETDWKLLAVRTDDPLAATLHDIKGAPASIRRLMDDIRTWFRMYKVPEGKGENEFAFNGAWQDRDTALAIVDSTHRQWRSLVQRSTEEQAAAARRTEFGEAPAIKASQGAPWVRSPIAPRSADFNLLEGQLAAIRSQLTIASKASLRAES